MNYNVTNEQITSELVNIFKDEAAKMDYFLSDSPQYNIGLCGWAGVMSPANHAAMVAAFGLERTTEAERAAIERIAMNANAYEATRHAAHRKEADANNRAGFVPSPGSFVWAYQSGMKNEGQGLRGLVDDLLEWPENCTDERRRLVCVEEVINTTEANAERNDYPDELVGESAKMGREFPGGARSEDDDYTDLYDEYKTFFTVAAAVVDDSGRWYLIDSEGFNYARYLLVPTNWGEMWGNIKTEREAEKARREAEAAEAARRKEEAEREDYRARCAKWEALMVDIRPLEQAEAEARKAHGWGSKEMKDAARKLQAAQRGNIAAMVKAAFPGLKISVRRNRGWGSAWELDYTDGPTREEFLASTDLDLFAFGHDTFDGMTDSADYCREKYTDFAAKYMGDVCGDIDVTRRYDPAKLDEMAAKVCEVTGKDKEARGYEWSDICKAAAAFGCDAEKIQWRVDNWHTARDVAFVVWQEISLYTKPEEKPARASKVGDASPVAADGDDTPASGLELVEMANGVAVVGDARATYKNRREIKAHGARWNKEAQQWQATEADAVAMLRAWFGK